MKEIIETVAQLLAESESNRSKADTAGQQRQNLLVALIEKAKKDEVVIKVSGRSGKEMEIKPNGLIFIYKGVRTEVIPHEAAPLLAHLKIEIGDVAEILDKVLRDEMKVTIQSDN